MSRNRLLQDELGIVCPYCGEPITVLADSSVDDQVYTEDCEVCCQPMIIHLSVDENGFPSIQANREND